MSVTCSERNAKSLSLFLTQNPIVILPPCHSSLQDDAQWSEPHPQPVIYLGLCILICSLLHWEKAKKKVIPLANTFAYLLHEKLHAMQANTTLLG